MIAWAALFTLAFLAAATAGALWVTEAYPRELFEIASGRRRKPTIVRIRELEQQAERAAIHHDRALALQEALDECRERQAGDSQ